MSHQFAVAVAMLPTSNQVASSSGNQDSSLFGIVAFLYFCVALITLLVGILVQLETSRTHSENSKEAAKMIAFSPVWPVFIVAEIVGAYCWAVTVLRSPDKREEKDSKDEWVFADQERQQR